MTDEQIERMIDRLEDRRSQNITALLQAIVPSQGDRERLVKIETTVQNSMLLMNSMRTEDLKKISDADLKATAAHRRIDGIARWVVSSNLITVGGMILTALFVYLKNSGGIPR